MKKIMTIALLCAVFFGIQSAQASITRQLDIGSTGSDVSEVQTYFATDPSIYPSGLVTGYFGPLSQAATKKFQITQGIVSSGSPSTTGFGRVGPQTISRLNEVMGSGSVGNSSWDTVPVVSSPTVQTGNSSATISWATNENTTGQVFYDTSTLRADEATGPNQTPYVSGTLAVDAGGTTNHSITIQNLQSNTTYNFIVRSIDSAGNITMVMPRTFHTN